eukprot:35442-Chlamydomonas_euryale.AAC.3
MRTRIVDSGVQLLAHSHAKLMRTSCSTAQCSAQYPACTGCNVQRRTSQMVAFSASVGYGWDTCFSSHFLSPKTVDFGRFSRCLQALRRDPRPMHGCPGPPPLPWTGMLAWCISGCGGAQPTVVPAALPWCWPPVPSMAILGASGVPTGLPQSRALPMPWTASPVDMDGMLQWGAARLLVADTGVLQASGCSAAMLASGALRGAATGRPCSGRMLRLCGAR